MHRHQSLILLFAGTLAACGGGSTTMTPANEPAATMPAMPATAPTAEVKPAPAPPPPPAPPSPTAMEQKLVDRNAECGQAMMAKDYDKLAGCFTDDATGTISDTGETCTGGKEISEKIFKPFMGAFSDFNARPTMILVNGNHMAVTMVATGTNDGSLMGMPPTHKKMGFQGLRLLEWADNKIKSDVHIADLFTLMAQLGVIKGPHRGVADPAEFPSNPQIVLANDSKTEAANVAVVDVLCDAFNKHDTAAILALQSDDAVWTDLTDAKDMVGKKSIEALLKGLFKALPDMSAKCAAWGAGDYVVNYVEWTATNKGAWPPFIKKASNKPVHIHDGEVYQLANGKIVHYWRFSNGMAFAQQIGLAPPPKPAVAPKAPKAKKPAKVKAEKTP